MAWKRHREDTSNAGYIANAERAQVGFDAVAGNGESESEAALVIAAPCERRKHPLGAARRQASAVVDDIEENMFSECVCLQSHLSVRVREFEGVLKDVSQRRQEQYSVPAYAKGRVHRFD